MTPRPACMRHRPAPMDGPPAMARPGPGPEAVRWHELAYGLVPRLRVGPPYPEAARLVAAFWHSCTPRATTALEAGAAPLLGRPPTAAGIAGALPDGASRPDRIRPSGSAPPPAGA